MKSCQPARPCPQCGRVLPADSTEGLCPVCLFEPTRKSLSNPPPPGPDSYTESKDTQTRSLPPGTRLGYVGDYELIEEVARGGMGIVYKALQTSLKRVVAVKTIRSGELADDTEVQRFHAEAEAAANLKHPNIVAIHEIGEHEGRHYFSMDYVAGRNLAQIIGGKPAPPRQAAAWLQAIAEAVQFAHQRGVLHRDLKPQNILVDAEGRPHVTDFGLAKNLQADSGMTQTGSVMGSPSYMAPEQARGRNDLVGPASDVYSLGAVLYELLTGRAPFRAESAMETLQRVVNDEPQPPRSVNADAPVELETVCLKCLEKDPAKRYPTARALAEDLERFLAGDPVLARPASRARKALVWLKHHPALMAGATALLIVGLFYTAYYLLQENAFLRAQQLNPQLEPARGPLTEALFTAIGPLGGVMFIAMIWVSAWFKRHALRTTWRGVFDPALHQGTWPVPPHVRKVQGVAGIIGALYSLILLALTIKANVWEGALYLSSKQQTPLNTVFIMPLATAWLGLWMLFVAWRDHVHAAHGRPDRKPDAATTAAIQQADLFKPWWDINAPKLALVALVELALILLGFHLLQPAHRPETVWYLAGSACYGAGVMISTRLRGAARKITAIAAPILLTFIVGALVFREHAVNKMLLLFIGTFAGYFLMVAAYSRKRAS